MCAQLRKFDELKRIDEPFIRCNFLIASMLAEQLSAMLPRSNVFPFGSALNGFAKPSSDMDYTWEIFG